MAKGKTGGAELKRLVRTIDDEPNINHLDVTPSVLKLSEMGLPAAKAVLGLLASDDLLTRKRAQRVLEGVVMRRNGWVFGHGYGDPAGRQKTQALIEQNGYQADSAPGARAKAIEKWRDWLEAQGA